MWRNRMNIEWVAVVAMSVFLLASGWSAAGNASVGAEVPPAAPVAGGETAAASTWKQDLLARQGSGNEWGKPEASDAGVVLASLKATSSPYRVDVGVRITVPVQRGRVMLLRFAARSIKPAEATGQTQLHLYFQKTSPDWFKSFELGVLLDDQWRRFDVPFKVLADYNAGEAGAYFGYGFAPQVAEIADVQLLVFPAGTDLTKLPRTQRLAGEVDPATYDATLKRIVEFRKGLVGRIGVSADVVKTSGRKLYVAAAAGGGGDGSMERPFSTLQAALDVVKAGDTVEVAEGVYDKPIDGQSHSSLKVSGRADAWIVVRAASGARPKIVSTAWKAFDLPGISYVEVRGFEFQGVNSAQNQNSGNGVAIVGRSTHIRVIDNVIHGFGGGGIYATNGDYVHIEGNTIYNTSKGSNWGNSAISLYQCLNSDEASGYKNVIRRNVCYDNENLIPFKAGGGSITDGNGIIIDDNRHTQNKSPHPVYKGWTLIENNLLVGNGGRGIHSYLSDRLDVINNTMYMNQGSKDIRNGELTAIQSSQAIFLNNIIFTRANLRANASDRSREVIFARNMVFNTDDFLGGLSPISDQDPMFAAPSRQVTDPQTFRLRRGSSAAGAGVTEIAPQDDLFGKPRAGPVDLGAIQGLAE